MLRELSIGTKLAAGFGVALAFSVGIGLFALYQLSAFNTFGIELTQHWMPEVELLSELRLVMTEHRLLSELRAESAGGDQYVEIGQILVDLSASVERFSKEYSQLSHVDGQVRLLNGFSAQWQFYEEISGMVFDQLDNGDVREGLTLFRESAVPVFDSAIRRLDSLYVYSKGQGVIAGAEVHQTYQLFLNLTVGVIFFAVLFVVFAYIWVTRNISVPIRQVSETMNQLSAGNRSVPALEAMGRGDEIGDLLTAAESYRASLVLSHRLGEEATRERERLLAAVANMPVGLSMFDAERRLIISNWRYAEMYQLPPDLLKEGTTLRKLLEHRMEFGVLAATYSDDHIDKMMAMVECGDQSFSLLELRNGRSLAITIQPMQGGGWVTIHEDVTARRQAEAQITHMARHDALTKLPNRLLFREQVELALEQTGRGRKVAILCLDLDQFKSVNDTLGHPEGDALLCMVAERLSHALREGDTVARLGGDEFAIVHVGDDQPVGATALAERIIEELAEPYDINGHHVVSGTSIGVAIAPHDGNDADQLLKNADMALYRAKQEGRGTYRFFETEMDTRMQERRKLELELRHAVAVNEFELFYQPQFNFKKNRICGFEALLRWNHPERGLVPPVEFLWLAEEIGLMVPIGKWVVETACKDAASWPKDLNLAVNLSPKQFKGSDLANMIGKALENADLAAERLELEITETVLLNATESVLVTLHELHALGVRISMDDFGTGYSSLSYLRSFPFDKIKIDRSFVSEIGSMGSAIAIVRAVAGLGVSLGIETTAEGVETLDQLQRVEQEGCTEVQGFLIGRPLPVEHIPGLLAGQQMPLVDFSTEQRRAGGKGRA